MNDSFDLVSLLASPLVPMVLVLAYFLWVKPRDEKMMAELKELNTRLDEAHSELDGACHHYVSTACHHANDDDNPALHKECRLQCKWCPRRCGCECHRETELVIEQETRPY